MPENMVGFAVTMVVFILAVVVLQKWGSRHSSTVLPSSHLTLDEDGDLPEDPDEG